MKIIFVNTDKMQAWKQPSFQKSVKAQYQVNQCQKLINTQIIIDETRIIFIYRIDKSKDGSGTFCINKQNCEILQFINIDNASMSSKHNVRIIIAQYTRVTKFDNLIQCKSISKIQKFIFINEYKIQNTQQKILYIIQNFLQYIKIDFLVAGNVYILFISYQLQHKCLSRIYNGEGVKSIEGTRQNNPVTLGERGLLSN
ncbi:hypothetical protein ABPG73_011086 [Tetrahymena malaccensis]